MVIKVENLCKTYGVIKAVDGISFEVAAGEIFGMLGPNGAGKTTTTEIIEGLREPDSGSVSVLGMKHGRDSESIKQRIGIQLQAPSLLPLLNVEEVLDLFGSFYKRRIGVKEVLERVSLTESRKVLSKNLSGGQQQRLSVAIALINDPEIAFLDEPTTGLDPQARRNLWSVVQEMKSRSKTVFLTTHYMEEAETLCDRLVIVDYGKIIAAGSPLELIRSNFDESAIQFEMALPPAKESLLAMPGVTQAAIDGTEVSVYSKNIPASMGALLKMVEQDENGGLLNLHVRQATLEDVFLKLTGRKIRE
ncbi:MAG: ABC transporter ATP-binding protein [Dehalococcoidaceae bacterium]|nr:ABC transporter ATP-binding protein [Dehalococcoidaceae bacterium]